MLYEDFDSKRKLDGEEVFTSLVSEDIITNLNPNFELREYQKEALGRFKFYFNGFSQRQYPAQILFHMATGSGKTLIMAANILELYQKGYRNFIFFVNSTNIIEKTKDNFLNSLSPKFLFSQKIKFGEQEVKVKPVDNFATAGADDINIVFTTIQGLHTRLNFPKENVLTYEDFEDKAVALISDEAHHLNTLTKSKLTKGEEEEKKSWEYTVERIFRSSSKNILLEFTATIDLTNPAIRQKYEDKIIFQYDLKQFRLDKYSKEIEVMEADLDPIDRALQAVILSQYRRKIAEKYKIPLKPVILFKSNYVNVPVNRNDNTVVSKEFKEKFLAKIKNLKSTDINKYNHGQSATLVKAFQYFKDNHISLDNLIAELKTDFDTTKCLSIDSNEEKEAAQILVNNLEASGNEIRAVFAVDMLNEGWDVLNLFDIVRLYNTRDAKANRPGKTTMAEAQLIGRGARYFPFKINPNDDQYKRKFDEDAGSELRILEQLFYHSASNPKYIQELKAAMTQIGIYPEEYIQRDLFFKPEFQKSDFWQKGVIYLNDRVKNDRKDILSFADAKINLNHQAVVKSGETVEETLLEDILPSTAPEQSKKIYFLLDFDTQIIRTALDRLEFYRFVNLKQYFPYLKSVSEFILSKKYLGSVKVEVTGPVMMIASLSASQKFEISLSILKKIAAEAKIGTEEFVGTKLFKVKQLKEVFKDNKIIKLAKDDQRAQAIAEIDLAAKTWFAQNNFYGTSEEQGFINFFEASFLNLKKQYSEIALIRNERYFKIFDFTAGRGFEPDFLLMLKKNGSKKVAVYQVFIEPKGDQFKDKDGQFELGKEGWKQQFLVEMEKQAEPELKIQNRNFKIIGLPFYNQSMKQVFEEAFEEKLFSD